MIELQSKIQALATFGTREAISTVVGIAERETGKTLIEDLPIVFLLPPCQTGPKDETMFSWMARIRGDVHVEAESLFAKQLDILGVRLTKEIGDMVFKRASAQPGSLQIEMDTVDPAQSP
jgi:hypothetical protein